MLREKEEQVKKREGYLSEQFNNVIKTVSLEAPAFQEDNPLRLHALAALNTMSKVSRVILQRHLRLRAL